MSFIEYLASSWNVVLGQAIAHAGVVFLSVLIATVLSVLTGMLVYRSAWASNLALSVTNVFLTVPSFAMFGIMIPILGLGWRPTVVALVFYGLLPILRNTITGLQAVDTAVSESAAGMGLSARQRLLRIDLPLAWPVIIAGVRVSTLLIMGIAAIAAFVNGPGLGNLIFSGLAAVGTEFGLNLALAGTLGVIVLALIFDGLLAVLERLTTSGGLK